MGWSNDNAETVDGLAVTYTNTDILYSTGSSFTVDAGATVDIASDIRLGFGAVLLVDIWHPVAYSAPWADVGGAYQPVTQRHDGLGNIQVAGVARTTIAVGQTSTIFTLPPGKEPLQKVHLATSIVKGGVLIPAHIDIDTFGVVTLDTHVAASGIVTDCPLYFSFPLDTT